MNFSDSEVVASILKNKGYELTNNSKDASLILLNTCSIRDKAEQTVRNKLKNFNSLKKNNDKLKVGVLGCMAERLKEKFLEEEKIVDLVVGPDSYKDLPNLLNEVVLKTFPILTKEREELNLSGSSELIPLRPLRLCTILIGSFINPMK